jgi:26S proteasome regulatory subunit N1
MKLLFVSMGLLFLSQQEKSEAIIETSKALNPQISKSLQIIIDAFAYTGTGNVLKIQQLLKICGEHPEEEIPENPIENPPSGTTTSGNKSTNKQQPTTKPKQPSSSTNKQSSNEKKDYPYLSFATLGIGLIAIGEELGSEMAIRCCDHLLQYCEKNVKRAVPLTLGILNISKPNLSVMDTLSKLTHDSDPLVAQAAIFALGLIGAGTNHARIGQLLRQLSVYYAKETQLKYTVKIAQGLLFMGKGLITLSPQHHDRKVLNLSCISGIITVLFSALDFDTILSSKYPYLLYFLTISMNPRMIITLDKELNFMPVSMRVGQAVDTVAQAGRPRRITGFQTHNSPVLLQYEDRAEIATEKYKPLTSVLEDVVILTENKDYLEGMDE